MALAGLFRFLNVPQWLSVEPWAVSALCEVCVSLGTRASPAASLKVSVRIRCSVTFASTLVSASPVFSRFVLKDADQSGSLVGLSELGAYRTEAGEGCEAWGPGGRAPHFLGWLLIGSCAPGLISGYGGERRHPYLVISLCSWEAGGIL